MLEKYVNPIHGRIYCEPIYTDDTCKTLRGFRYRRECDDFDTICLISTDLDGTVNALTIIDEKGRYSIPVINHKDCEL